MNWWRCLRCPFLVVERARTLTFVRKVSLWIEEYAFRRVWRRVPESASHDRDS
jgi:hypothetical protein